MNFLRGPSVRHHLARLELGPQQIYIYIYLFACGKQRDPNKAKKHNGERILGKLSGPPVDGRNPFRTTLKPWLKPLFAGIFRLI